MPQIRVNGTMLVLQIETAPHRIELKLTATTALLRLPCGCQSIAGKVFKDTFKHTGVEFNRVFP